MRMQVRVLMADKEPTGLLIGDVTGLERDLHVLQHNFGLMKDTMASELSVLEGTVPDTKELQNMGDKAG
eukprot:12886776-Prorocentrum_lima.AAC.1